MKMKTNCLVTTSNIWDRFFSKAGYSVDETRRSIISTHVEEQIFLRVNRSVGNLIYILNIINNDAFLPIPKRAVKALSHII